MRKVGTDRYEKDYTSCKRAWKSGFILHDKLHDDAHKFLSSQVLFKFFDCQEFPQCMITESEIKY